MTKLRTWLLILVGIAAMVAWNWIVDLAPIGVSLVLFVALALVTLGVMSNYREAGERGHGGDL